MRVTTRFTIRTNLMSITSQFMMHPMQMVFEMFGMRHMVKTEVQKFGPEISFFFTSHVASFSDTCVVKNRNKYVATTMLYAVNIIDHLQIINLQFMSSHSYLEDDSMHATIKRPNVIKNLLYKRMVYFNLCSQKQNLYSR